MSWGQPFGFGDEWPLFGWIMFKRTGKVDWRKMQRFAMTVIEIRPFRNGWQVYEEPGVQPVFPESRAGD